jgi:uncharacterized protein GlcG (DUF336 family)
MSDVIQKPTIGSSLAARVIEAAAAQAGDAPATIAVVDESGVLKAFTRLDGAGLGGVELAVAKARMAVSFGYPTEAFRGMAKDDVPFAAAIVGGMTGVTILAGGVPITVDGALIGAVGVSAATEELDSEIAQAGAAAAG